jgi:hypothetical protein
LKQQCPIIPVVSKKNSAQSFIYFLTEEYLKSVGSTELTLKCYLVLTKPNRCIGIHGTNTSEELSVTANCNGMPVCNIHATENLYIIYI